LWRNGISWQHKGSSYYLPQNTKLKGKESIIEEYIYADYMEETSGEYTPPSGEIDYNTHDKAGNFIAGSDLKRTIATEKDVLGLIWLTKLKIQ
jgi:hypothetical protein